MMFWRENENEHKKGKLAIFKLAVFIMENFLDDEKMACGHFSENHKKDGI